MSIPNWDNTFLSSLWVYRKLRGGKWYLRHYLTPEVLDSQPVKNGWEEWGTINHSESWGRYGGKSPMSHVVKSEDYTPPPSFIAGLGGTLISGKW